MLEANSAARSRRRWAAVGCGRAGLQRNRHRAELDQSDVDDGVVDTGEPQDAHTVTGPHRLVAQRGCEGVDAVPQLAVGDGLEAGQQLREVRPVASVTNSTARWASAGRSA